MSIECFWVLSEKEMARRKDSRVLPFVTLRMVILSVSREEKERSLLEEDLWQIGCDGLME